MEKKRNIRLALFSFLIPLAAALIVMSTYRMTQEYVKENYENLYEKESYLSYLFRGNYLLYKNLYEKVNGTTVTYADLYLTQPEGLLDEDTEYEYSEEGKGTVLAEVKEAFNKHIQHELETTFYWDAYLDYYIEDISSGISISNTVGEQIKHPTGYAYYLELIYDENGFATVNTAISENEDTLTRNASRWLSGKNVLLESWMESAGSFFRIFDSVPDMTRYGDAPKNCRIIYALLPAAWEQSQHADRNFWYYGNYGNLYQTYRASGLLTWIFMAWFTTALFAFLMPREHAVLKRKLLRPPLEALLGITFVFLCGSSEILSGIIRFLSGKAASDMMERFHYTASTSAGLATALHVILLYLLYALAWYVGLGFGILREKGIKRYLAQNSFCYQIFPYCKRQAKRFFSALEHIDLSKKTNKTIKKLVILNAILLFIISTIWVFGYFVIIIYSLLLYFCLKLYVARIQKRYAILLEKIREISAGNLNVEISEDLGIFEPMKEELLLIQTGFRNAVEEEIKSQKMRSELITNVSHDLKTPLTAIITYLDLLKEENLTEEQELEYLTVLETKTKRLKLLIEDLFEISKANSGSIVLQCVDVDLFHLVKQVRLEMEDKLTGLDVRMELPEIKVYAWLDSQKTYRIYENLFVNIAKYSLPGTRVYVTGSVTESEVTISLKNISAAEIEDASRLTERFVRGDISRGTDGSGLGLAIVKSFVELQGGSFYVENDGDLFKAVTTFPIKQSMLPIPKRV